MVMAARSMDKRQLLASVPIFACLREPELELLLDVTTTKRLATRDVLFRKGDPGNQLYAVLEGRLKILAAGADGKEVVFGINGPGEVIGEIALMDSNPRSATVVAMEACELLTLHRRDLIPFLEKHPKVTIELAGVLAARLRRLSEHTEDALFLTLPSRLAKMLLQLSATYGQETPDGVLIDIRLPQQDLADLVGTTRESVNKQLRSWEEEGLVKLERTRITITQREALEATAAFLTL
jgi:CRP/FNR family cyclic AMP-dependent transcriptional regulator